MPAYDHHDRKYTFDDHVYEEDHESVRHRKYIRNKLEKKYEHQWLKRELEDYEGELDEFDWSDIESDKD